MTALKDRFARLRARVGSPREWELNPVVVKELRQAVRSWAVTGMLLLFLAVLFCTSLIMLVTESITAELNPRLGGQIFSVFTLILTGASLAFIPLYVGIRVGLERQESNLDLLYVTTLTPQRIIRGKFLCGAYVTVLFFSACMPFMVFTTLLRGVDIPSIAFILLCLFIIVCAAVQAAIFVACMPISKVLKILCALAGFMFSMFLIAPLGFLMIELMGSGIGSMLLDAEFWGAFGTSAAAVIAVVMLLYYLSVALISPASMNRALPIRVYLTILWAVGWAASFIWMWKMRDAHSLLPWAMFSGFLLIGSVIVIVSNQDALSPRVRRDIPAHPFKRAVAFLFFNGAAGGLIWAAMLLGASFLFASVFLEFSPKWFAGFVSMTPEKLRGMRLICGAVLLYVFAYALLSVLLHRKLFPSRPARLAGIFLVLLPALWALLPGIVQFFANRLSWKTFQELQLGNLFNVGSVQEPEQVTHLFFAAAWLVIMMALNANWFRARVREFRRLDPRRRSPAPAPMPPPIPASPEVVQS